MDRAYEDDKTRALASDHGFIPVVPPKKNRKEPWEYDKKLYKRRNEVERFFLRLKRFRKVCTRYDKLDVVFLSVIMLAMIFDAVFMWTRSNTLFSKPVKIIVKKRDEFIYAYTSPISSIENCVFY